MWYDDGGGIHNSNARLTMIFTVAIEPDIKLVERLTFLQEDLGKIISSRGADSRWSRPEYMHIPLLCMHTRDEDAVPELNEVLQNCAHQTKPFSLTIAGISAYPSSECPRIVRVSVQENSELTELRTRLMESFRAVNIGFDSRDYQAAMLLGRVATHQDKINITNAINAIKDLNFGQSEIYEIVLYGSELGDTGAVHHVISRFFFDG